MQATRRRSGELRRVERASGVFARHEQRYERRERRELLSARVAVRPAAPPSERLTFEAVQRVLGILSLIAFPAAGAAFLLGRVALPSYVVLSLVAAVGLVASLVPLEPPPSSPSPSPRSSFPRLWT
jgi:hypothetical protein